MNATLQRILAAGEDARLKFLRALNRIAMLLLGGVVIANAMYSGVIAGWLNKLPPMVGIPLLLLFGALVEYASRQPKAP